MSAKRLGHDNIRQTPAFNASENFLNTLGITDNIIAIRLTSATSPLMAAPVSVPLTIFPGIARYANTGTDNNKSIAKSPLNSVSSPKNKKAIGAGRGFPAGVSVGVTAIRSTLEIRNTQVSGTATTTPKYSADTPKTK